MKVYCKDCKWFATSMSYGPQYIPIRITCVNPDYIYKKDTPLCQETFYGDYRELNMHNDCKGFKPKVKVKTVLEKLAEKMFNE